MDSNRLSIFRFSTFIFLVNLFVFLITPANAQSFDEGKELVIVRKIGHEILLKVGNKDSRVLPVKRISPKEYLITFEHPFSFQPGSLIEVVDEVVEQHQLPSNYLVNVIDCSDDSIVYAYAVLEDGNDNIIPCRGRDQPKKCYRIHLQFAESSLEDSLMGYIPGSLALLAGFVVLFIGIKTFTQSKPEQTQEKIEEQEILLPGFQLGKYRFSVEEQLLQIEGEKISLTGKESKLLHVFVQSPDRTLDRDVLQDKVWGNEGVIVGRSLDMFISKLRKKLSKDPLIKLVNIHGKGYKLEIKKSL